MCVDLLIPVLVKQSTVTSTKLCNIKDVSTLLKIESLEESCHLSVSLKSRVRK